MKMNLAELEKPKIKTHMSMLVVGASQQGKSEFVIKLIENNINVFDPPFERIDYHYSIYQEK